MFGSYVRGEHDQDSDLDLLVEFGRAPSLLSYIALESFLSEQLGVRVDLVMRSALKPRIGAAILREVLSIQ